MSAVPAAGGAAGFTRLPAETTGIQFTNFLSAAAAGQNQIRLNGSGVALGDVDGDGLVDIYLCRLEGANALYRNLGGWKFEEITGVAGVGCDNQFSTGALLADVDGDGDLDLLVNAIGSGTRLFVNDGHGKFLEDTNAGLDRRRGAMSMAMADIDGDGDLDLYVANYRTTTIRSTGLLLLNANGRRSVRPEDREQLEMTASGRVLERGEPDFLCLNDGHGKFAPQSWTEGRFEDEDGRRLAEPPHDWGLSVAMRDINQDGFPDIYVCNDFQTPDRIWLNDGKGNFRALPRPALRNTSTFSMGVDFADINRDGWDDFILLDMLSPSHRRRMIQSNGKEPQESSWGMSLLRPQFDRNVLQMNRGDGTHAEAAYFAGMAAAGWAWAPVFLDVDLDGFEDLLVTTGNMFDTQDMDAEARIQAKGPWPRERLAAKLLEYPPLAGRNLAFRNQRDGRFLESSDAWGWNAGGVSQGVALADLDNDGDLDLVVNRLNDGAGIFRNETSASRVAVMLKGAGANTRGIGARLKLVALGLTQEQEIMVGGRYLSGDAPARVFGAPAEPMSLQVRWPDGRRSEITNVASNRIYEIDQNAAVIGNAGVAVPSRTNAAPLFTDFSSALQHRHPAVDFAELDRQPLLPRRLAREGPGVSWIDVDGDGWDDLVLGGAPGKGPMIYHNDAGRSFTLVTTNMPGFGRREGLATVGVGNANGPARLWSAASSYRDIGAQGPLVVGFSAAAAGETAIPQVDPSAGGALALTDFDGDGQLDLFVGGRVIPGRYPAPASSHLYQHSGERWVLSTVNESALKSIGLVTSAVWTDLNRDGWPDLALACEWGPLKILMNEQGVLKDRTDAWGLTGMTGLWMAVAAGDFDGDGRMDLVAANIGLNTEYQASAPQPLRLHYGDFAGDGHVLTIETEWDEERHVEVPRRDLNTLAVAWAELRERYPTHHAFSETTLANLLTPVRDVARTAEVTTLTSVVLLNRGDRFEIHPLPAETQMAPAFGVTAGDFDGDGHADVFMAQNFFSGHAQSTRNDAGRGLLLRGDGKGGFAALSGPDSGIKIYGEQRSSAASDFDRDGRLDLAVTQQAGETVLLRNEGAKPGLRARLLGPAGNPNGLGACVRPRFKDGLGPVQEFRAGSGFLSQDGVALIFGEAQKIISLEVRWPGSATLLRYVLPGGARAVRLQLGGAIEAGD